MTIPLFIGTYSVRGSQGLYGSLFDLESGHLDPPRPLLPPHTLFNPTYQTVWNDRLYTTGDAGPTSTPPNEGRIVLFRIQPEDGSLERVAEHSCGPGSPCHVVIFDGGRRLAAAHYKSGELYLFRLDAQGRPLLETIFRYPGRGPVPSRQDASHFHAAAASPDRCWLVATDLGQDALFVFRIQADRLAFERRIPCPAGSGPRHLVFSFDSRWLWVTGELDGSVLAFRQEADSLALIGRWSVRPEAYTGNCYPAEIRLHPNGSTLFVSTRGADEIVVCHAASDGRLEIRHRIATVAWPRGMILSPDGRYLLAASQHQDEIAVYAIGSEGALDLRHRIGGVPSPVSFAFASTGSEVITGTDRPIRGQ